MFRIAKIGLTKQQIFIFFLFISIILTGCTTRNTMDTSITPLASITDDSTTICHITEPIWVEHPEDAAVLSKPAPGYYFVNQDRSMWASASVWEEKGTYFLAGEKGNKVGWFRPAGEQLEISGQRVDDETVKLDVNISCCYPTRFQATKLIFPTEGCWEIRAMAGNSELSFIVKVGL